MSLNFVISFNRCSRPFHSLGRINETCYNTLRMQNHGKFFSNVINLILIKSYMSIAQWYLNCENAVG